MIKAGQVWVWPRNDAKGIKLEYHIIKKINKHGVHYSYYSPDFGAKHYNQLATESEFNMEIKMYCKLNISKTMKRMQRIENKRGQTDYKKTS